MISDTGGHVCEVGDFAIRKGNWKLIVIPARKEGETERRYLFDLDSDPGEQNDQIEEHPSIAAELADLLEEIKQHGSRTVECT